MTFKDFIVKAFSEPDGTPSASRLVTLVLAIAAAYCACDLVHALVAMPTDKATLFLPEVPWIIGALAGLASGTYAVNKGTSVIAEVLNMFRSKDKKE